MEFSVTKWCLYQEVLLQYLCSRPNDLLLLKSDTGSLFSSIFLHYLVGRLNKLGMSEHAPRICI